MSFKLLRHLISFFVSVGLFQLVWFFCILYHFELKSSSLTLQGLSSFVTWSLNLLA
jgi:hypothetical protein